MKQVVSPSQLARAVGVSESSVKRWVDGGLLGARRTAGGHRRIPVSEAIGFVRGSGLAFQQPEALGLTDLTQAGLASEAELEERLFKLLLDGRTLGVSRLVVSAYVGGAGIAELCDGPVRGAMRRIGELWHASESGVYVGHRATAICDQVLGQLRMLMPAPEEGATLPVALGGALEGDTSTLPSLMVSLVLAAEGLEPMNLGPSTPIEALERAIEHEQPRLVWLSVSHLEDPLRLLDVVQLAEQLSSSGIPLALGGRALSQHVLPPSESIYFARSLTELAAFARGRFS
jgi:methanogenic corrinoid protein MtbC1